MKKFLAILMALLMVVSVLSLAGCKKEEKSKAEIFVEAYKSILVPKAEQNFINPEVFSGANAFSFDIDKLSMESMGETVELPEVNLDVFKTGDKSFDISAALKSGEDKLSALLSVKDLKEFVLSVPEATDLYISGTFGEILESAKDISVTLPGVTDDKEVGSDTLKELFGAFADAFANYDKILLKDENFATESVEREVFGEKLTLEKLTLKLDIDDIFAMVKAVLENAPAEIKAELEKDGKTVDDAIAEVKKEADFEKYEIAFSFFLNDKDVRRIELSMDFAAEGVAYSMSTSADILNTADTYKEVAEMKTVADGEEVVVKATEEYTVKDGKITGEMTFKPESIEVNSPEGNADDEMIDAIHANSMEFTAEINGTYTDNTFDIEIEGELGMGSMALKLPISVKGETSDKKLSLDIDTSFDFMGVMNFELGMVALVEKTDGDGGVEIDLAPENAVSVNDSEKLGEFGQAVSEYFMGLEGFAELFGSFGGGDEYDDSYSNMYTASNEDGSFDFYSDGTGTVSTYCDLTVDEDAGTFTIIAADGSELVITLTGDDTADINGATISYEGFAFGGNAETYIFDVDDVGTEIWITPYLGYASLERPFEYTDSVILIDGIPVEYTVDETELKMTIGGIEYEIHIPIYED